MKIQDLLLEMNYIDKKYIEECDAVPEKKKTSFRRVRFVLIAAVVAVLLAVTAFAVYELTLTKVVDKSTEYRLVEVHEKYDKIDLSKSENSFFPEDIKVSDFTVGYIPDGFELSKMIENEKTRRCAYSNNNGDSLNVRISENELLIVLIDNENCSLYKVESEFLSGYLNYNENEGFGTLILGDKNIVIRINGPLSKEELVKIAESITYEQK